MTVWVFDVDGCAVDSHTGTSLRPGVRDLLVDLRAEGCRIVWWSAGGDEYARRRAAGVGVSDLVDAFHGKDERGPDGRYLADHVVGGASEVVFVDARPEDLPAGARSIAVSPYLAPDPHDRGLERALRLH